VEAYMNKPCLRYFEEEDVLHLVITDQPESRSVELSPNLTVELNDKNEMIGVEILHASSFLRNATRLDSGKDFAISRPEHDRRG